MTVALWQMVLLCCGSFAIGAMVVGWLMYFAAAEWKRQAKRQSEHSEELDKFARDRLLGAFDLAIDLAKAPPKVVHAGSGLPPIMPTNGHAMPTAKEVAKAAMDIARFNEEVTAQTGFDPRMRENPHLDE